jgi:hypothetical protein
MQFARMSAACLPSVTSRALSSHRVSGYPSVGAGGAAVVGVVGDVGETGVDAGGESAGRVEGGEKTRSVRPLTMATYICEFRGRVLYSRGVEQCGRGSGCGEASIASWAARIHARVISGGVRVAWAKC